MAASNAANHCTSIGGIFVGKPVCDTRTHIHRLPISSRQTTNSGQQGFSNQMASYGTDFEVARKGSGHIVVRFPKSAIGNLPRQQQTRTEHGSQKT